MLPDRYKKLSVVELSRLVFSYFQFPTVTKFNLESRIYLKK